MSKSKSKLKIIGNTISGTVEDITSAFKKVTDKLSEKEDEPKPFEINSASIKEELCNYGYEIKTGPGAGDKIPTRKGSALIHQDMTDSFLALNIHLALLDDAFKYSGKEPKKLDEIKGDAILDLFSVSGFKIQGSEENEGYIIIGSKWVTHGGISLETPKVSKSSNYPFFDELLKAVTVARNEVELYMNGKCTPQYEQGTLDLKDSDEEDHFSEEKL